MAMQNYDITITVVEKRTGEAFGPRYAWETGEKYSLYLNVVGIDAAGQAVYFNTPAIEMRVTSGGPVAVVTYDKGGDWLTDGEGYAVGPKETPAVKSPEPKIAKGDRLTVRGKIKKTYRNGFSLSHVKFVKNHSAAEAPQEVV